MPLRFPEEPESAALGAALQAAAVLSKTPVAEFVKGAKVPMSGEVVEPNVANAEAYAQAFRRHVGLGETLFESEGV